MQNLTKEQLEIIRKNTSKMIAEELVSVQPMPSDVFKELLENSKSEKQLIEEGYEPVDKTTKLMWVKKEDE